MNTLADATVPEKILLAAFQLEEESKSPFSAEDLIVASWKRFPKTLGLKGYAELYPDSNKEMKLRPSRRARVCRASRTSCSFIS